MTDAELGLARVVRDLGVDAGGQRAVVGPAGLDQPGGQHVAADRDLHARRELLRAHRLRRHPDRHVVVAGLVAPRARRVRAGQGVHLGAARREVLDGRGDPAHEQHLRALRRPDAQLGVGDALGHRLVDQRLEVRRDVRRVADQVDGAQQRGRDLAQLGDLPAGADAARVALEVPGDVADRASTARRAAPTRCGRR